jgi:hypothetical protein
MTSIFFDFHYHNCRRKRHPRTAHRLVKHRIHGCHCRLFNVDFETPAPGRIPHEGTIYLRDTE